VAGVALALAGNLDAAADERPDPVADTLHAPRALQLEVFVDGYPTNMIAEFLQENGTLLIEPEQLRNLGLMPAPGAVRPDGLVDLARLPGVAFMFDEARQTIHFTLTGAARAARAIEARRSDETPLADPPTSVGALVNYTLYASTGGDRFDDLFGFEGASGLFEGRLFGPHGTLSAGLLASTSDARTDVVRLDTTWSWSDQRRMLSYRAGDVIAGGLAWTRPVRLGGLQVQRNFALRPDLVTFPLPELTGSAAVPSTVELFVDNARYLSEDVQPGPFAIRNIPVVTGAGMARVVVRDALGRETVSEVPFSPRPTCSRRG
jgi:outer membrane usher protein